MRWMAVFAMAGLVTFGTRLSFIALLGRADVPPMVTRALRLGAPGGAVRHHLPDCILPRGRAEPLPVQPRLVAGLVASAVALWTRSVLATIAAGMAALWALQALLQR